MDTSLTQDTVPETTVPPSPMTVLASSSSSSSSSSPSATTNEDLPQKPDNNTPGKHSSSTPSVPSTTAYETIEEYHYYRLFQQLPCATVLHDMQLWPNTKEITESMACLIAIQQYILPYLAKNDSTSTTSSTPESTPTFSPPSLQVSHPRKHTIVVVGDGGRPRTGALLALTLDPSVWTIVSIDPDLIYDSILDCTFDSPTKRNRQYETKLQQAIQLWKTVPNLVCLRGRIQDVRLFTRQTIIVMMHAHVNFTVTVPSIDTSEGIVGLITAPCCNWIEEHARFYHRLPDQEYTDKYLLSEKNLIRIWYQQPRTLLAYDPLYIFQDNKEQFMLHRQRLLQWDIRFWYLYPVYRTGVVDALDVNHQVLVSWSTVHAKCVQIRDGLQTNIQRDVYTMLYGDNNNNNGNRIENLPYLCLLPTDLAIIVRELAFPSVSSVPIRLVSSSSSSPSKDTESTTNTITANNITHGNRVCTIGMVKSVRILKSILFVSLEDLPSSAFQSFNVYRYMEKVLHITNEGLADAKDVPSITDPSLFQFRTIQERIRNASADSTDRSLSSSSSSSDRSLSPLWSAIERSVHFEHTAGRDKRPVQAPTVINGTKVIRSNGTRTTNDLSDEDENKKLYQLQFCASRIAGYDDKLRPKAAITQPSTPTVLDNGTLPSASSTTPSSSSTSSKSFVFPRVDATCIDWLPHLRVGDVVCLQGIIGPIVEKYKNVLVYIEKAFLLYNSLIRVSHGQVRLIHN